MAQAPAPAAAAYGALDITPFLADSGAAARDFDAVAWLNGVLEGASSPTAAGAHSGSSTDALLSAALVRLQLLGAEVSDRVEASMARIVAALPRLRRDAKHMGGELPALLTALREVEAAQQLSGRAEHGKGAGGAALKDHAAAQEQAAAAEEPEQDAEPYLRRLARLDTAKARLEAVAAQLATATAWDRLLRDTEGVFADAAASGGGYAALARAAASVVAVALTKRQNSAPLASSSAKNSLWRCGCACVQERSVAG